MRSSSCLIEFPNGDGDTIRCGRTSIADCADCGVSICSECQMECCGESFCDYCHEYHLMYSCLRKPALNEKDQVIRRDKNAA